LIGREDDEHSDVRNGGPKLRIIRDRRLCATRNRAASTVRRAQSKQLWLALRSRRAFIEA
jgi:hypothetical protein